MLDDLNLDSFKECLNNDFQVIHPDTPGFRLKLSEAVQLTRTARQDVFSLIFQGGEAPFLTQGIYTLEHGALGRFDIFLVPVGRNANGFQYEAAFNRLVESGQPA